MSLNQSLLAKVQPYTLCTSERLESLAAICQYLNAHQIPGDFVECGTYKGGTAAIVSQYLNQFRHLWLYDSFAGMPNTTEKDSEEAKKWVGQCVAAIEDVREIMQQVGTCEQSYTIRKGWFETTFQQQLPSQVALLHCDADWYDSVTLVLETFYPLIPLGGCIVLDDFGYWEGCREAFYDFCDRQGEKPLLERVGTDQAYWIKGRANNRMPIANLNNLQTDSLHQNASQAELEQLKLEFSQAQENLSYLHFQLQQALSEIDAMHSSKFWQLRTIWFKLKQQVGLSAKH